MKSSLSPWDRHFRASLCVTGCLCESLVCKSSLVYAHRTWNKLPRMTVSNMKTQVSFCSYLSVHHNCCQHRYRCVSSSIFLCWMLKLQLASSWTNHLFRIKALLVQAHGRVMTRLKAISLFSIFQPEEMTVGLEVLCINSQYLPVFQAESFDRGPCRLFDSCVSCMKPVNLQGFGW